MPRRRVSLNGFTESLVSSYIYRNRKFDNDEDYKKVLKILSLAMQKELTERQLECVTMYYGDMLRLVDIADKLNVAPSTVCRHLQKAKKRLQHILEYYFKC